MFFQFFQISDSRSGSADGPLADGRWAIGRWQSADGRRLPPQVSVLVRADFKKIRFLHFRSAFFEQQSHMFVKKRPNFDLKSPYFEIKVQILT